MPEDRRREGIAEIDRALALAPKADRERRYITALSGYLHGDSAHDDLALASYVNAMGALHRAYPDDVEAHAFYGVALAAAANVDSKDPIGADRKALAVLELGFRGANENGSAGEWGGIMCWCIIGGRGTLHSLAKVVVVILGLKSETELLELSFRHTDGKCSPERWEYAVG